MGGGGKEALISIQSDGYKVSRVQKRQSSGAQQLQMGKWKMLKCGNGSTEMEVWKWKYGNGSTEVRRKAAYRYLVPY